LKKSLKKHFDYLAPDGSEIRLLSQAQGGGLCHCTLTPGKTSYAVKHKTVEEIWYFISGKGEMWQSEEKLSKVLQVQAGDSINIPVGICFQFRNTSNENLCIIIITIPKWPGEQEAVLVEGYWK